MSYPELSFKGIVKTSEHSPDSLPITGYTMDQLIKYIMRQCGSPTWQVELTPQQVIDNINDAMSMFSQYRPLFHWGAVPLIAGKNDYLVDEDVGQGIADVTFVENRLGVLSQDFSNPFTAMSLVTTGLGLDGIGDYDSYLRWQNTWQRVTSTLPSWQYDDMRKTLWIHNPIARYRAAILIYRNWPDTKSLPDFGCRWVKEYSLAKCQQLLGEIWMKFSGAIPGPGQNIQLDSLRREKATEKVAKLELQLQNSQECTPITTG